MPPYINRRTGFNIVYDGKLDNVVFRMAVRLNQGVVFRTDYNIRSGFKGNPDTDGGMPFKRGQNYNLAITRQEDGFQVDVNGVPFTKYIPRYPIEENMDLVVDTVAANSNVTSQYFSNM